MPTGGLFPLGVATGTAPPAEPVQLANADGMIPNSALGSHLPYIHYPGALTAGATSAAKDWVFTVPNGVSAFEFTVTIETDTR